MRVSCTIRHVESRDLEQWTEMRVALWPDGSEATHRAEAERFLKNPSRGVGSLPEAVLVAVTPGDESRLAGFAELARRPYAEGCTTSPVGFLEGWYVVPEYRRRGIGGALVAAAEAWARERGCTEFASDALADNVLSQAAHAALGFEEVEVIRCFKKAL